MDKQQNAASIRSGNRGMASESGDFVAPFGSVTSGRLVFASGAGGVTIHSDPALSDLYRAHFEGHVPSIRVQEGTVTIQYRHFRFFDWLAYWREPVAEINLNGSIPWEIEFHGGVSRLTADLSGLPLRALDLSSASQVVVTLPQPLGAVFIHASGSVSDLIVYRPAGVAVRIAISGSASSLTFDEQYFGAVADGLHWQTPDYHSAANRYDISISGSASSLTIATR